MMLASRAHIFFSFILMVGSISSFAESLRYQDINLNLEGNVFTYQSKNLSFSRDIKTCARKVILEYMNQFSVKELSKLEKMKLSKNPVIFFKNNASIKTYQGSKLHLKLDSISKKILLLKYRVENKC